MGSRVAAAAGTAAHSMGDSAKDSVKSGLHGLGQSLTKGKGSGSGGGGKGNSSDSKPTDGLTNRFSTIERRNASNEKGNRKTGKEFGAESKQMGAERYSQYKQTKQENATKAWKSQISNNPKPTESAKRYDGGTPLGQSTQTRQPEQKPSTPPPSHKGDA